MIFHSYVSLPEGSGAHKPTYNWEGARLVDSTILRFINNMKGYMMNWILWIVSGEFFQLPSGNLT